MSSDLVSLGSPLKFPSSIGTLEGRCMAMGKCGVGYRIVCMMTAFFAKRWSRWRIHRRIDCWILPSNVDMRHVAIGWVDPKSWFLTLSERYSSRDLSNLKFAKVFINLSTSHKTLHHQIWERLTSLKWQIHLSQARLVKRRKVHVEIPAPTVVTTPSISQKFNHHCPQQTPFTGSNRLQRLGLTSPSSEVPIFSSVWLVMHPSTCFISTRGDSISRCPKTGQDTCHL